MGLLMESASPPAKGPVTKYSVKETNSQRASFSSSTTIAGRGCEFYNVTGDNVLRRRIDIGERGEGSGDKEISKKIDAEAKSKQEMSRKFHGDRSRGQFVRGVCLETQGGGGSPVEDL
jgi:hypothetical protein